MIHVKEKISPRFEISSIIKAFDQDGRVLFFDDVENFETKVVANACGNRQTLCEALNSMRIICTPT